MTYQSRRRDLLKGIGAGAVGLTFIGSATAATHDRYIVAGRGNGIREQVERAGFTVTNELADGAVALVTGADDAAELADVPGVQTAIPDLKIAHAEPVAEATSETADNPAYWDQQWDKHVTDVDAAHEVATGDGSTIAILDTGIDHTHPDLDNVDVGASRSVYGGELHDHIGDINGHGTHVGGIAAATGEVGVVGTAPDAELVSLRVFTGEEEDQDDFWGDLLLAIDYAAGTVGADAINMSIGTIETLDGTDNAGGIRGVTEPVMQYASRQGTVVVGSAGNHGASLQQGGSWTLPNSLAGVMSVSATGPNDELVFYSNYGTNEVDIGAPGGGYETREKTLDPSADVAWPYPTNLVLSSVPEDIYGTQYTYFAGTSMAAPQVAGAVALVRDVAPDASANQVESAIKHGADLIRGRNDSDLGAGRLNAAGALDALPTDT